MSVSYEALLNAKDTFEKSKNYRRALDCLVELYYFDKNETRKYIIEFRKHMQTLALSGNNTQEYMELFWESYKLTARDSFDDFCMYIEKNRPLKSRFYIHRRKQLKPVVNALQDLEDDKLDLLTVSLPPGVGKLLADDTPVLTKNGWKNHGDLVVGDMVIGLDGKFKKVIAVHPKNIANCLVEFTNGEKIQCHENHQWLVHDRTKGGKKTDYRIYDTKTIENSKLESGGEAGHRGHRYNIQIPQKKYVVGEHRKLPLDPYTLGVWLGDGTNQCPLIANPYSDKNIIDKIIENGTSLQNCYQHKTTGVWYYSFDFRPKLREMGMCHSKKRLPKYIPEIYLTADINQRLQLLAGLLDTDGHLSGRKYSFSTTSEELRDGFISLISTFGWRACITANEPKISSSGIQGKKVCYIISFTPDCKIPCVLERKKNKSFSSQRAISIKSITRVEPKQGNCITVEGDGTYLAGKTLIPTHNSTLSIFYILWLAGKYPNEPILTGSHSNSFLRGVYDECLRILNINGEYAWHDVFPEVELLGTNAKDMRIDLGRPSRFETLEFGSIGSGNAGKLRAVKLLYCDDLIPDLETAMSRERLDKLWNEYTTDLRQRKAGACKELHIATRWSVHDVIGRLEAIYRDNPRAKFISVPALDENDESNFDYPHFLPSYFTTSMYREQREIMDDVSWRALYMNEPIEREGQLYNADELRRYFELPDKTPDAILAICDTKDKGTDYCVMPVAYQYGNDYYIEDIICDNSNPEIVEERLVATLEKNAVHMAQFESNSAGGKIAEKVQGKLKERGARCKITTKYTTSNKETKIIVNSPWVKEHCLFKDDTVIKNNKEYRLMLNFLTSYTMIGKNKHDDVPDAFAMFAEYIQGLTDKKVTIRIVDRFF